MTSDKETKERICDSCRKQIDLGYDLITTEKCVNGPRGIVPLGKIHVFCSEKCVKDWFSDEPVSDVPDLGFRVP